MCICAVFVIGLERHVLRGRVEKEGISAADIGNAELSFNNRWHTLLDCGFVGAAQGTM